MSKMKQKHWTCRQLTQFNDVEGCVCVGLDFLVENEIGLVTTINSIYHTLILAPVSHLCNLIYAIRKKIEKSANQCSCHFHCFSPPQFELLRIAYKLTLIFIFQARLAGMSCKLCNLVVIQPQNLKPQLKISNNFAKSNRSID